MAERSLFVAARSPSVCGSCSSMTTRRSAGGEHQRNPRAGHGLRRETVYRRRAAASDQHPARRRRSGNRRRPAHL